MGRTDLLVRSLLRMPILEVEASEIKAGEAGRGGWVDEKRWVESSAWLRAMPWKALVLSARHGLSMGRPEL